MSQNRGISRRQFLQAAGFVTASAALAACAVPVAAPGAAPATGAAAAPAAASDAVRVAVLGFVQEPMQTLLETTGFTDATGLAVEVLVRSDTKEVEMQKVAGAVQAGTSPYDVLDYEDELVSTFSQAGYMAPLQDYLSADFWEDFPAAMIENAEIWSTYDGNLTRVHHNWEAPFWFYRKDWFDEKGVSIPTTWDEVRALGEVFTDEANGVWASSEGLLTGAFLNVYLAWVTRQAGGSPFDVGDEYRAGLEYTYNQLHGDRVLNPASLQIDYNQQNADYLADRVAFMRQWPFFLGVARGEANSEWYSPEKVTIALPPAGPGGENNLTYAAGWGFGILNSSPNLAGAEALFKHLVDKETAVAAVGINDWFLSARHSVLEAANPEGVAGPLKMYSDAGAIALRPFHPQFVEALTIIETTASSYLTDQIDIETSMQQAADQLAALG